jgi:hypothetical protein
MWLLLVEGFKKEGIFELLREAKVLTSCLSREREEAEGISNTEKR